MTVSTTNNKKVYAGLTSQDTFAYDFRVDLKADMNVYFDGVLQSSGDWTITNLGNPLGGDVVLNTPLAANTTVTLLRVVTATQTIDYQPLDAFPAETHEAGLDKLTFLHQQLDEEVDRSAKLGVDVEGVSSELPDPIADQFIGWNSSANGLTNMAVPSGGVVGDGTITEAKLAVNSVSETKIVDGAVTNAKRDYPSVVTNHIRAGNVQLLDGEGVVADLNITTTLAQSAWRTIGPTGFGGNHEWAAMDNLPANATIILVDFEIYSLETTGAPHGVQLLGSNGDDPSPGNLVLVDTIAQHNAVANNIIQHVVSGMIPLGLTNQDFYLNWTETGVTHTLTLNMRYRGFMTD